MELKPNVVKQLGEIAEYVCEQLCKDRDRCLGVLKNPDIVPDIRDEDRFMAYDRYIMCPVRRLRE